MDASKRAQGGLNNQRGNRYEDLFALFKLAEYASRSLDHGEDVRFKAQAGCPVDDLQIEEAQSSHFHQLKTRRAVS